MNGALHTHLDMNGTQKGKFDTKRKLKIIAVSLRRCLTNEKRQLH